MDADDFPTPDVEVDSVDPSELKAQIDDGDEVTILDARATGDFEEWHIEAETVTIENVPYFEFIGGDVTDDLLDRVPEGDPLVVLCAKGGASEYVAGLLKEEGRDVVHLEDGMNGWARIYERFEVSSYDGPGTVYQYLRPSSGCLSYMIVDGDEAAVIDPLREFTDRYLDDADELGAELTYAFDTHIHADHVSGVRTLDERGVTGVIPEASEPRGVAYADELTSAADGDTFAVGDVEVETVFTPGHTSGMTSYLVGDGFIATGDGLFAYSVARPDLEEGDEGAPAAAAQLYDSLQEKVLSLDDDVVVGGAHLSDAAEPTPDGTYTKTIGRLVEEMDALSASKDEFVEMVLEDMPPRPANYVDIIETNLGQREADDEEAFELELGPNNCAASQGSMTGD
jgi:glyoxylase-like metal-dependent hydrolase (beta-lactamase superfamily II)